MQFPTQHKDLRKAWLYLLDHGQQQHADTIFHFAAMYKRTYEDMERFQNMANELQRTDDTYESIRQQAIKQCGGSRKAANE